MKEFEVIAMRVLRKGKTDFAPIALGDAVSEVDFFYDITDHVNGKLVVSGVLEISLHAGGDWQMLSGFSRIGGPSLDGSNCAGIKVFRIPAGSGRTLCGSLTCNGTFRTSAVVRTR